MNSKIPIKGVFFDLYGTILEYGDMVKAWDEWLGEFQRQMETVGFITSSEEFSRLCNGFFSGQDPPKEGDLTSFEIRIKFFCQRLGVKVDAEQIKKIGHKTVSVWQSYVDVDPEAKEVICRLQEKVKTGLISNFDHPPHVYNLLEKYGLKECFDVVVVSGAVGVKKPDPGIFQIALHRTGLDPREVIYVGDAEVDIRGALKSAMIPVLIKRPGAENNHEAARDYRSGVADEEWSAVDDFKGVRVIKKLSDIFNLI